MTHTHEPVPYMIYDSRNNEIIDVNATYDEKYASSTNIYFAKGHELINHFFGGK